MVAKLIIAIDIDDVLSETNEATRLWANQRAGLDLQPHHYYVDEDYWAYYNRIWASHNVADKVQFETFLEELVDDQTHVPLVAGAAFAITQLRQRYGIILITARDPSLEASTKKWLAEHFDFELPLYLSHNPKVAKGAASKGELCARLGVSYLIDDNIDNCQSAIDHGVEAILFGDYGWNTRAPETAIRCKDWPTVVEYFDERSR